MDRIILVGAQEVEHAGSAMREAAASMKQTASSLEWALTQHQRHMDDWLQRFEAALEQRE